MKYRELVMDLILLLLTEIHSNQYYVSLNLLNI